MQHGLVALLFAVCTLVLTYPLSILAASHVRDAGDPLLFAWMLAWMTRAIFSDPLRLFRANTFYPFPDSLAFTDAPVAMVPIVAPVIWLTHNPVLAVNVATLVAFLLSGLGAYLLVWHLTRSAAAGTVAGLVFAFAPYKIAHLAHLQLLTSQWIPLTLLFLHRGFGSRRWRDFWGFAACFILQVFSGLYYALFLALSVAFFSTYLAAWSPRRFLTGFLPKLAVSSAVAGLAVAPWLAPYWRMQRTYRFERTLVDVRPYSADLKDYLTVPPDNRLGGVGSVSNKVEHCLWMGLQPIFLALFGICLTWPGNGERAGDSDREGTPWSAKPEVKRLSRIETIRSQGFYLALGGCAYLLSLGPELRAFGHRTQFALPYRYLFQFVPGFQSIRAPARFGVLVCLAVAVLAGYGMARIEDELKRWGAARWLILVIEAAIALVVIAEYASFPLSVVPIEVGARVPSVYRWLTQQEPDVTVVELPAGDALLNSRYAYFSTYHWRRIVNGHSSFMPESYGDIVRSLDDFPSSEAIAILRSLGVRLVVVHGDFFQAERLREIRKRLANHPELVHLRSFGDDHVYRVRADAELPRASLAPHRPQWPGPE